MIEVRCGCGKRGGAPEEAVGKRTRCNGCGKILQIVSGEAVAPGAGLGDFDAALVAEDASATPAGRYVLGGIADIGIGKLADRQIVLAGQKVSRRHCKLVRVDFGPSRWKIVDEGSTNGLFVNEQRVTEQELRNGDVVRIGELCFRYCVDDWAGASAPTIVSAALGEGPVCPSCEKKLGAGAKICVECGVNVASGRTFFTRQEIQASAVRDSARNWIRLVSWFVRITPLPMPLRSEAFGARKPYAIWSIAAVTILVSFVYFLARYPGFDPFNFDRPGKELMLWSPWASNKPITVSNLNPRTVASLAGKMTETDRENLRDKYGNRSDYQLISALLVDALNSNHADFHWYQLITHMFLHDTSSILGFATHLGGNMLFLLVFGTRVNGLIGDLATVILYPVLGICAAMAQILGGGAQAHGPMLGASGAIMGLAGIYLILFPLHRVFCAMWIRVGVLVYKIFAVRGIWILLIYFVYDVVMNVITARSPTSGGVAHWAHIGGFTSGMLIGLSILLSRQFAANGGDLLSVTLGKRAWPLIGKPSQWTLRRQTVLGTAAFAGSVLCVVPVAALVLALYDPRSETEKAAIADSSAGQPAAQVAPAQDASAQESSAPAPSSAQHDEVFQHSGSLLPVGVTNTAMVGGNGGMPYVRIDREKRPVIGFVIRIGSWSGHATIGHCDPMYAEPTDSLPDDATICLAKEGYAVGGIVVNKRDGADGLQIIFMKMTDSGVDVNDSYLSPWFGYSAGANRAQLTGHGQRVIGIFGRQGMNMDAIGLLIQSSASTP